MNNSVLLRQKWSMMLAFKVVFITAVVIFVFKAWNVSHSFMNTLISTGFYIITSALLWRIGVSLADYKSYKNPSFQKRIKSYTLLSCLWLLACLLIMSLISYKIASVKTYKLIFF